MRAKKHRTDFFPFHHEHRKFLLIPQMHTTTDHPSKVTVVMPVYNGRRKSEHYLPEAIDSVLAQTYPHFELIIVDDGSDEDYSDLMEKYRSEPRIRWVRKENGGQSSARNYGATLGTGQFLAFIDQDDRWYPLRLEKLSNA